MNRNLFHFLAVLIFSAMVTGCSTAVVRHFDYRAEAGSSATVLTATYERSTEFGWGIVTLLNSSKTVLELDMESFTYWVADYVSPRFNSPSDPYRTETSSVRTVVGTSIAPFAGPNPYVGDALRSMTLGSSTAHSSEVEQRNKRMVLLPPGKKISVLIRDVVEDAYRALLGRLKSQYRNTSRPLGVFSDQEQSERNLEQFFAEYLRSFKRDLIGLNFGVLLRSRPAETERWSISSFDFRIKKGVEVTVEPGNPESGRSAKVVSVTPYPSPSWLGYRFWQYGDSSVFEKVLRTLSGELNDGAATGK